LFKAGSDPEAALYVKKKRDWKVYFRDNWFFYLMLLPVIAYFIVFCYVPMYGLIIAWKRFVPTLGILGSQWVGWTNFTSFFNSYYFGRILGNTFFLSFYSIIWTFPLPIIFALMLNEVRNIAFKRITQTISYLPHFISTVIICGFLIEFLHVEGFLTGLMHTVFGLPLKSWLSDPSVFRSIYISSDVWQSLGWSAIIYIAAMAGINTELYDAAEIDGCGMLRKMWNVSLPGILPTIVILLILRMGSLLDVGAEKMLLIYSPATYSVSDIISTFVYRRGIFESNFSYSTAVGLFNSIINLAFLFGTNWMTRRVTGSSLW
jgi:putative aldouronate transport system permease protein